MQIKHVIPSITLAILAALPLRAGAADALKNHPAYLPVDTVLDMAIASPEVNVNLPKFLLLNAVSELDGGPDDPFAKMGVDFKDLVKGIELIRVLVIESNDKNREHIQTGVKTLRQQLDAKWINLVSVPEDGIGIYALGNASGDSMQGLALIVDDGGDVIIGNLVGEVALGKVLKVATRMKGLPPGILKKFGQFNGGNGSDKKETPPKTDAKPDDSKSETKAEDKTDPESQDKK